MHIFINNPSINILLYIYTFLLAQMLTSGMAVLGCVREVKDYEVTLTLPGGLQGVVSITDISDAYREQLKVLTQNPQSRDDDDMV